MDYLQYFREHNIKVKDPDGFKPYYKWITFNIFLDFVLHIILFGLVLNLIINGLPSISQYNSTSVGTL